MNVTGRILDSDGMPLEGAKLTLLAPQNAAVTVIAEGLTADDGSFYLDSKQMPWALQVNGLPLLAVPAGAEPLDFGILIVGKTRIPVPVWGSADGIWGGPRAFMALLTPEKETVKIKTLTGPSLLPDAPATDAVRPVRRSLTTLVNDTQQTIVATNQRGVRVADVRLKIKGLVSADESNDLAMEFVPPTGTGAVDPAHLSELDISVTSNGISGSSAATKRVQLAPTLLGYTLELARRKLASLGLGALPVYEQVAEIRQIGRVLRQEPAAGEAVAEDATVRIYLGRANGVQR